MGGTLLVLLTRLVNHKSDDGNDDNDDDHFRFPVTSYSRSGILTISLSSGLLNNDSDDNVDNDNDDNDDDDNDDDDEKSFLKALQLRWGALKKNENKICKTKKRPEPEGGSWPLKKPIDSRIGQCLCTYIKMILMKQS